MVMLQGDSRLDFIFSCAGGGEHGIPIEPLRRAITGSVQVEELLLLLPRLVERLSSYVKARSLEYSKLTSSADDKWVGGKRLPQA
jgi:hypothetical protein